MAVVEFQILPSWFELDTRTQRDIALQIGSVMGRYSQVDSRWFDADAWTGEFSDFVICEFEDLQAYNELWSEMRRHPFLATPYARIGQVLMGMELEVAGLAQHAGPIEIDLEPHLELPPETGKPSKPVQVSRPALPPTTKKPSKAANSSASDKSVSKSCHFCGHQLKASARYCSRCGTSTTPTKPH